MRIKNQLPNYVLMIGVVFVATVTLLSLKTITSAGGQQQDERAVNLPQIISKVKKLEVVSTTVKQEGGGGASVAIELRNNSDKPIVAVAVESGDEKDASGVSASGFNGTGEPPSVIIQPHGTYTINMPLNNLLSGAPLKVGGVIYADDTEDGDALTLKTLRGQQDHDNKARDKIKSSRPHQ